MAHYRFRAAFELPNVEFFGGAKVALPLAAALDVGDSHSLVFVHLQGDGDEGADLGALLADAFGVEGLSLRVRSAGFFALWLPDDRFNQQGIESQLGALGLPTALGELMTTVGDGGDRVAGPDSISFWAELALSTTSDNPFTGLIDIGSEAKELVLYGSMGTVRSGYRLDQEDVTSTVLLARLPPFTLLGTLVFSDVVIGYQFAAKARYRLSGLVSVTLFDRTLAFRGALDADEQKLHGVIEMENAGDEVKPFASLPGAGEMGDNVVFSQLAFRVSRDFGSDSTTYALSGEVAYGAGATDGAIVMAGATPALIVFSTEGELVLSKLVSETFGIAWPSGLVDLKVSAGAALYYFDGATSRASIGDVLPAGTPDELAAGFHVSAHLEVMVASYSVAFAGTLGYHDGEVEASIRLDDPIEILCVTLSGASGGGPTFEFAHGGGVSSMSFRGAATLFHAPFGATVDLRLEMAGDEKVLSCELTADGDWAPVISEGDSIGFAYGSTSGLTVTDWPPFTQDASTYLDFISELRSYARSSSSGLCGALVGELSGSFSTHVGITPSFESPGEGRVVLKATGTCTVTFEGSTVATITSPSFDVDLPTSMTLGEMPGRVLTAIGDAAPHFLEKLIDDPTALAALLGLAATKQALQTAANEGCDLLTDAVLDAALAVAADVAADGAAAAAAAAAGIAGVVIASSTSGKHSGGNGNGGNGNGGNGHGGNGPTSTPLATPRITSLAWVNGALSLQWTAVDGAAGYESRLLDKTGQSVGDKRQLPASPLADTLPINPPAMPEGTCMVQVRAVAGQTVGKSDSGYTTRTLQQLGGPPVVERLTWAAGRLTAEWTAVTERTPGYELRVDGPSGWSAGAHEIDGVSAGVEMPVDAPAGDYHLKVRARGADDDTIPGPWSAPGTVPKPAAPVVTSLTHTPADDGAGHVEAQWSDVAGSAGYQVRIVDGAGDVVGEVLAVAAGTTSASIDLPDDLAAGVYRAEVQTIGETGAPPSAWSAPSTDQVAKLAAPAVTSLLYVAADDGSVGRAAVAWGEVEGGAGYRVRIVDANGAAVGDAVAVPAGAASASVDLPQDLAAGTYRAEVEVEVGAAAEGMLPSGWGAPSADALTRLAAPEVGAFGLDGEELSVSWEAVPDSGGYVLGLTTGEDEPFATFSVPSTQTGWAGAPPEGPAGAWRMRAMTRTKAAQRIPSAWGAPSADQVAKLAAPVVTSLRYAAADDGSVGRAAVAWGAVAGGGGYQVRIVDAGGAVVGEAVAAAAGATSASVHLPQDLAAGMYRAEMEVVAAAPGTLPSGWGTPSEDALVRPVAPVVQQASAAGLNVSASWTPVAGNGGYELEVLAPDVSTPAGSALAPRDAVQATVHLPAGSPPGAYRCRVRTAADATDAVSLPSAWSASLEVEVQTGPEYVGFGPVGRHGSSFDDTDAAKQVGVPISHVIVRSDQIVDSIQAFNGSHPMPKHGGDGGGQTIVTLDPGDVITEVSGYYGPWYGTTFVLQLTLKTARGLTYGPFGTMGGSTSSGRTSFSFSTSAGRLMAFSGSVAQAPEAGGSLSSFVSSIGATFLAGDSPGPIPEGISPIVADSAGALVNAVFGVDGSNPSLPFGSFNPVNGTVTATRDGDDHKIVLSLGESGTTFTASNTVVCCANARLRAWDWYATSVQSAGRRSVWTAGGWADLPDGGSEHLDEAVALGGLYFYKVEIAAADVPGGLSASLGAGGVPFMAGFLATTPARQTGLFPAGFAPVLAPSDGALVDSVFAVDAESPTLPFGKYDAATATVTATPDSSSYKVLFALADTTTFYSVTTTVVGCSTAPLTQWDWYERAGTFAGTRSVWTSTGWNPAPYSSDGGLGEAVELDGRYFYKIELDGVEMGANLGCFIQSSSPAAVSFFVAPEGSWSPVPGPQLADCQFVKRLEIPFTGYGIIGLDTYFDDAKQLIAYGETSGNATKNDLVLYDYSARQRVAELPLDGFLRRIRFIDCGNRIAYAEAGRGTIVIVDAQLQVTKSVSVPGLGDFTTSRDGTRLVAMRNNTSLEVYDLTSDCALLQSVPIPRQSFDGQKQILAISPDSTLAAVAGGYKQNVVVAGSLVSGVFSVFDPGSAAGCYAPAFLRGDRDVVVGGGYGDGRLYAIDTVAGTATSPSKPARNYVYDISLSADRRYLICGGYDGTLTIMDTAAWGSVFTTQLGLVNSVQFTRDMKFFVSGHGAGSGAKVVVFEIVPVGGA